MINWGFDGFNKYRKMGNLWELSIYNSRLSKMAFIIGDQQTCWQIMTIIFDVIFVPINYIPLKSVKFCPIIRQIRHEPILQLKYTLPLTITESVDFCASTWPGAQ